jgi:hypothetical protein
MLIVRPSLLFGQTGLPPCPDISFGLSDWILNY